MRFVRNSGIEMSQLFNLRFKSRPIIALCLINGVDAGTEILELFTERQKKSFDLNLIVVGKFDGFLLE